MRREYVTFLSPGTFVSEETTKELPGGRDVQLAIELASGITERYGAKPYGFYFSTMIVAEPVSDGEGGTLSIRPKEVDRSGMYFLGGDVMTLDQIELRNDPDERILLSNMRGNDWPVVVVNTNSYKVAQPFREEDCIVNVHPNPTVRKSNPILVQGNAPKLVAYRAEKIAERRAEMDRLMKRD